MDAVFKLLKVVKDSHLFNTGDRVIIGVSGGVDSVVLLDALVRLQPEYRLKLCVAHMNYGLRGKESDRDERFVRGSAKKNGVKCFVQHVAQTFRSANTGRTKVLRYVSGSHNLQNTARDLRYDFFLKVAKKFKADKIAVAHHADDQAETVLIHLTRGSGLSGLVGMTHTSSPPLRPARRRSSGGGGDNIVLIRPLLSVTKDELLAYAKERKLKYVQDRTNRTKKYHRNVIRHELLPLLKKYNPNIVQHLCKTAAILRDENDALDEMSYQKAVILSEAPARRQFGGKNPVRSKVKFNRSRFLKLHIAIRRRILRLAYARLTGGTADLLTDHIDKMMWIISSGKKEGRYTLPRGIRFLREGNKIVLIKETRT